MKESSAEDLWRNLLKEYRWVYTQMNEQLREVFRPFFLYAELRTLFIGLRHVKDTSGRRPNQLLEVSLLSDQIKKILTSSNDVAEAVGVIEKCFLSLSDEFKGLTESLEADGLRGVEQKVANTYLAVIVRKPLHPVVRTFFARLIDARNVMNAYKHLRLEERKIPPFISGGTLAAAELREMTAKEDLFGISSVIRKFFGIKLDTPEPTKVELALYKGITLFLRKEGREPFGAGPILDYLWRCSLEVMNLSVLIQCKDLEREAVAAELVQ